MLIEIKQSRLPDLLIRQTDIGIEITYVQSESKPLIEPENIEQVITALQQFAPKKYSVYKVFRISGHRIRLEKDLTLDKATAIVKSYTSNDKYLISYYEQ